MTHYHDIRPIIRTLEYANNIHDLIYAKDALNSLIIKYLGRGYVNWEKTNEAKGIHTWTWGEIRPMLTNPKAEIEDFERRYVYHPDTVIETTSDSETICGWEIKRYEDKLGSFHRAGLKPIIKQDRSLKIHPKQDGLRS